LFPFLKRSKNIIDIKNSMGKTALTLACVADYVQLVEGLLYVGADTNIRDKEGTFMILADNN
jgi:ankyrin repeat protein